VLHEGATEGFRFAAFFRAEEDEFEAAMDVENGVAVFKTIEAVDAAFVEK